MSWVIQLFVALWVDVSLLSFSCLTVVIASVAIVIVVSTKDNHHKEQDDTTLKLNKCPLHEKNNFLFVVNKFNHLWLKVKFLFCI